MVSGGGQKYTQIIKKVLLAGAARRSTQINAMRRIEELLCVGGDQEGDGIQVLPLKK